MFRFLCVYCCSFCLSYAFRNTFTKVVIPRPVQLVAHTVSCGESKFVVVGKPFTRSIWGPPKKGLLYLKNAGPQTNQQMQKANYSQER